MRQAIMMMVVGLCAAFVVPARGEDKVATAAGEPPIARARRLIQAGDRAAAVDLLEEALIDGPAADRSGILDLLRQSYEAMAREAEAAGRAAAAAHYRDNLSILERSRPAGEPSPAPRPQLEPAKPPAADPPSKPPGQASPPGTETAPAAARSQAMSPPASQTIPPPPPTAVPLSALSGPPELRAPTPDPSVAEPMPLPEPAKVPMPGPVKPVAPGSAGRGMTRVPSSDARADGTREIPIASPMSAPAASGPDEPGGGAASINPGAATASGATTNRTQGGPAGGPGQAEADALFKSRRFDEAGRIYTALAVRKRLPDERRPHWAYCRFVAVVRRIKRAAALGAGVGPDRGGDPRHPAADAGQLVRRIPDQQGRRGPALAAPAVRAIGPPGRPRLGPRGLGTAAPGRATIAGRAARTTAAPRPDARHVPGPDPAGQPRGWPARTGLALARRRRRSDLEPPRRAVRAGGGSQLELRAGTLHRARIGGGDRPCRASAQGGGIDRSSSPRGGERRGEGAPESLPAPSSALRAPSPRGGEGDAPPESGAIAWQVRDTPNFRIYHCDPALAERAGAVAESVRTSQARRWGGTATVPSWSPRCELYLYPTARQYADATGQPERSPGISTMSTNEVRVLSRRMSLRADNPLMLTATLPHEVTHVVLADLFVARQIPRWADEGLAVLAEPASERHHRQADLKQPLDGGRVFKVGQLMAMDYPAPEDWALFYAQSVSLTQFLVEQGPPQRFIQFVRNAQRHGADAALRDIYQIDGLAALQERWLAYARQQAAVDVASSRDADSGPEALRRD